MKKPLFPIPVMVMLPGIVDMPAQPIPDDRAKTGRFRSVGRNADSVGEKRWEENKNLITIGG